MNSLSSSTTKDTIFINLADLSSNTLKDASSHVGGNIGRVINQIRETVVRKIIWFLNSGPE